MRKNGFLRVLWCYAVIVSLLMSSCVTRKKKGDVSKLSKFYHNVTSEYNGYFNANELYNNSMSTLVSTNEDNFTKVIELYDYISVPDPKVVNADLDKAIEKVTRVAALHQKGDWVDDCYLLMAKSQFLKQDYEKAEETLEFFEEEYNPTNPYGKNFKKRKPTAKERKQASEELKKERAKEAKEKKKLQEEEREERKEAAEKVREEKAEASKIAKEARQKATEQARKDKEQKAEEAKKARTQAASEAKAQQEKREQEAKREKEAQEAARKKEEVAAKELDKKQETTNESRRDAAQRRIDERKKQIEDARAKNLAKREQSKKTNADVVKAGETPKTTGEPTNTKPAETTKSDEKVGEIADNTDVKKEEATPTKTTPTKQTKKEDKKEAKKEDPKKEEEKKEEVAKKEDKKKDKKKEEDKTKYNEGLLWLARTYIKRENFSGAEFTLKQLEEKSGISKNVQELIPVAYAELYIKQKDYKDALPYLDEAIKIASKKNNKARYAFAAGQIMEMFKNPTNASSYYATAQKNAKDFKLKFMSTLAAAKMEAATGGKSPEQVVASISKFLKESKYDDLRDQIYFSMGEIILGTDKPKAKEYFAMSSIENKSNKSLKGEACFKIAELELSDKNFASAKLYYDTTMSNINSFDDRFYYVKNMTTNLEPIANNIFKVKRADSLLTLAKLSDSELNKWAKNMIKNVGTLEAAPGNDTKAPDQRKSALITPRASANVNSNFFAYNTANNEIGKTTFKILWGERKNENNWRRSVKSYQATTESNEATTAAVDPADKPDEATSEKIKAALSSIPKTVEQQARLQSEKKTALFELGRDFREKLKEYQLSVDALEDYFKMTGGESSETDKLPEAMYIAFMDYNDLNQSGLADAMKRKMAEKFPNDKYAKLANDPSFLATLNADARSLDKFYEETLALFNNSDYKGVIDRVEKGLEAFGKENKLVPKFHLLNAMALGATQGKEFYIKSLQELIQRYPKTEEETKAKEILRFLNGDGSAFKEVDVKEVDDTFVNDENTRHYIAVIIMSFDADALEKAKISISDYNKQYHRSDNLQYGESALSQGEATQILLVRSFENMAKARIYYDGAMRSKNEFVSNVGFEILPISQANYRKMMAAKTHSTYRAYFEKNYLK